MEEPRREQRALSIRIYTRDSCELEHHDNGGVHAKYGLRKHGGLVFERRFELLVYLHLQSLKQKAPSIKLYVCISSSDGTR